jgi:hypothetical protein
VESLSSELVGLHSQPTCQTRMCSCAIAVKPLDNDFCLNDMRGISGIVLFFSCVREGEAGVRTVKLIMANNWIN